MANNSKNVVEGLTTKAENLAGTVKDRAMDLKDRAVEFGENLSESARNLSERASERASSAYSTASEKASNAYGTVSDKASSAMSTAGDKATSAMTSVGESMSGLAETLRDHAPAAVAPYARRAAASLEQAGNYLEQGTIGDMVDDITGLVHKHPLLVLLAGLGLGFVLARKRE